MIDILLVLGGLAALVFGGDWLVRGSVSLARSVGIPPLVIGLTLVGFGTSTPELVTSLQAASVGAPGIAVGNVVGSNIGNILLILGLTALLRPVLVDPAAFRRDGSVMLIATLLAVGAVMAGTMGRGAGALFLAVLLVYLVGTIVYERRRATAAAAVYEGEADLVALAPDSSLKAAGLAIAGLIVVILGARLLVSGAVALAEAAGISETVIGLTIVAIGTSMPELVTSIVAVRRGEGEVAFGNVVGSNIFNILGILGITALVSPLAIPPEIIRFDIWVMLAATLVMMLFAVTGWRVGRREGAIMLAGYGLYLAVLLTGL